MSRSNVAVAAALALVACRSRSAPPPPDAAAVPSSRSARGTGPLVARIETSAGTLRCTLDEKGAPDAVAAFVSLARRGAYDGGAFDRALPGTFVEGGGAADAGGARELAPAGKKHDRAGLLCAAGGGRFAVTDGAAPDLDGAYPPFGECLPVPVVHAVAGAASASGRVAIRRVYVARAPRDED